MGGLDRMAEQYRQGGLATGEPEADALLKESGTALLLGVLLDQQVRAEVAFSGPWKLHRRLGHLDLAKIAAMDDDALGSAFAEKPAVHRFTNMMAGRVKELAAYVVDTYGGDATRLWESADLETLRARAGRLPGFGKSKVQTLVHALELFGHRTFADRDE